MIIRVTKQVLIKLVELDVFAMGDKDGKMSKNLQHVAECWIALNVQVQEHF